MSVPGSNTGNFGIPHGGPWFVFPVTGTIKQETNGLLEQALAASGWVGFPDQASAAKFADSLPSHAVSQAAAGPLHTVTGFLAEITNPNLWLRVAEVGLGLVLVAVGIARLTGVDNKIATLAKTAGKAAVVA